MQNLKLKDYTAEEIVGIQISCEGHRIWVCIDGQCVLRVKIPTGKVVLTDLREGI